MIAAAPERARIVVEIGDIAKSRCDAIVTAANELLSGGGGVDRAVHAAAGPDLLLASRGLAPLRPGRAVATPGYRLCSHVIHAVGPRFIRGSAQEAIVLRLTYSSALDCAERLGARSVAMPIISSGAFGWPIARACAEAARAIVSWCAVHDRPGRIVVVCFDRAAYEEMFRALEAT